MDFLGVGPLELLIIMLLALIVVGPERLPELAKSIGKTMRTLRSVSSAVTAEWQRELESASEIKGEDGETISLKESLDAVRTELQGVVSAPAKTLTDTKQESQSSSSSVVETLQSARVDVEQALSTPLAEPSTGNKSNLSSAPAPSEIAESPSTAESSATSDESSSAKGEASSTSDKSASAESGTTEPPTPDPATLNDDGDHVNN